MNKIKKKKELTHKICKVCNLEKPISDFRFNRNSKDNYASTCMYCQEEKRIQRRNNKNIYSDSEYYLYRFKDDNNNIIYVGKTNNIKRRIYTHFSTGGHLPSECYEETKIVEFVKMDSEYRMALYEIQLMYQYNAKYNQIKTNEDLKLFILPKLDWQLYAYIEEDFDKSSGFAIYTKEGNENNELWLNYKGGKYLV